MQLDRDPPYLGDARSLPPVLPPIISLTLRGPRIKHAANKMQRRSADGWQIAFRPWWTRADPAGDLTLCRRIHSSARSFRIQPSAGIRLSSDLGLVSDSRPCA